MLQGLLTQGAPRRLTVPMMVRAEWDLMLDGAAAGSDVQRRSVATSPFVPLAADFAALLCHCIIWLSPSETARLRYFVLLYYSECQPGILPLPPTRQIPIVHNIVPKCAFWISALHLFIYLLKGGNPKVKFATMLWLLEFWRYIEIYIYFTIR